MIRATFSFILLMVGAYGHAQQYHFINYSVEQGLSQTQVFDINQDKKGYLWIATIGGISRFDGKEFKNYSARDGLFKNQGRCLVFDNNNRLWVGSDGGYSVLRGDRIESYPLPDGYKLAQVNAIVPFEDGTAWIGTDAHGLIRVKNGKLLYELDSVKGLNSKIIRGLFYENNTLFIASKEGVFVCDDGLRAKHLFAHPSGPVNTSHITKDKMGNYWISTFGTGVWKWDGKTAPLQINQSNGLVLDWVRRIVTEENGSVWAITRQGLSLIEGNSILNFTVGNGLHYENLRSGMIDREGNLWLGSDGKGIYKFTGRAFQHFIKADGLPDELILSVSEDKRGQLFLGTLQAGMVIQTDTGYYQFSVKDGLPSNTVWAIAHDKNNNSWIGTSLGLVKYHNGNIRVFNESSSPSLPDNRVTSVFCDRAGNIWAGTRAGVTRINRNGTFDKFTEAEGLYAVHVRAISQDADGNIWIGAENGAFKFDGKNFRSFSITSSQTEGAKVYCIERDHFNRMWFGTENGLFVLNDDQDFNYINLSPDSRADFINFLMCDRDSGLWIGTNYGIFELNIVKYNSSKQLNIKSLTYHEGLKNLECNLNAAFQTKDGDCWFGTGGGLVRLNHKYRNELNNDKAPELILKEILLFREKTDWSQYSNSVDPFTGIPENLTLPWNKHHITFSFIGISFKNPDFVQYQYRLEGADEDWWPVTADRTITYSNLPPGDYTFLLRASNSAGKWTESSLQFSFRILPPFWTTWWFYSLLAFAVILIIWALIQLRINVIKRKQKSEHMMYQNRMLELEQQSLNASMNRHFIFNALNSIQYYINRQDKLSANRYLTSFAKLIRKNLDSSAGNNMVPLSEELERLQLYLSLEHMRFQDKLRYEINVSQEVDAEQIEVPAMLLQPFVENSIWHGILPMEREGKIFVRVFMNDVGALVIEIEDNGIGVEESARVKSSSAHPHVSRGMKITGSRIELLQKMLRRSIMLKGPYQLYDKDGNSAGTKVEIIMDLENFEE